MNTDKIEQLAIEVTDVAEDCCDVANGEFIGFDRVGCKSAVIEAFHRYFTGQTEVEESVINKIIERRDIGRKKYGTSMEREDLNDIQWMTHAQEEALDTAIYLEKMIQKASE
jgi:hypothetical protein